MVKLGKYEKRKCPAKVVEPPSILVTKSIKKYGRGSTSNRISMPQTYNPSTTYASFPLKISQQFFTNKNG